MRDARKVNLIEISCKSSLRSPHAPPQPGISLLAICALRWASAPSAAVFSWIEGILFRPYPAVAHQERSSPSAAPHATNPAHPLSWPDFQDLQRSCTLLRDALRQQITRPTLSVGDRADRTTGASSPPTTSTPSAFPPASAAPSRRDQGQSAHPVAVISHQLWQGRFRGDRKLSGKTQRLNGVMHTIVGVAPKAFTALRRWA